MKHERTEPLLLALAACVVAAGIWLIADQQRRASRAPAGRRSPASITDTQVRQPAQMPAPGPTPKYAAASPLPGRPTPATLGTRGDAIAYAKAVFDDCGPWTQEYAVRTRYRYYVYWHSRTAGVAPLPTADAALSPTAQQNWVMWLVGLRSEAPISRERAMSAMGLAGVGRSSEPWTRHGGYQVYLAFDDAGMIYAAGLVDLPDETGTPRPVPG